MNDQQIWQMFADAKAIIRESHFVYSSGRHSSVYVNKDAQWVAHFLNVRRSVGETLAVYAEKEGDGPDKNFLLRRGYDRYIAGKNVLVVEDVLTTGGSARQVIELVRQYGGKVVGLSALCNRGNVQPRDVGDVPISTLIDLTLETFAAEECPFCQQGVPINTELGKGKAFLAKQR